MYIYHSGNLLLIDMSLDIMSLDAIAKYGQATLNKKTTIEKLFNMDSDLANSASEQIFGMHPAVSTHAIESIEFSGSELVALSRFWYNQYVLPYTDNNLREFFANKFPPFLAFAAEQKALKLGQAYSLTPDTGDLITQAIRPETVFAGNVGATGTPITIWSSSVKAGWNTAYFSINMNQTSSNKLLNTLNNAAVFIMGFANIPVDPTPAVSTSGVLSYVAGSAVEDYPVNSQLLAVQAKNSSKNYGVYEMPLLQSKYSNKIALLPDNYMVSKGQLMNIDVDFLASGVTQLIPLGAQVVTSDYVVNE